ncbi:C-type lectin domain family 2 member E [Lemmus lemmus]
MGKKQQGQCLSIVSTEPPVKLYCCYVVIMVLTVAVIALSVALSEEKPVVLSPGSCYANCPNGWFGFGSKCFYFSDDVRNWTLSQTYCMEQGAQLARFDSLEELNFMKRYAEIICYWIGLYRETSKHPWKWTDNTEYNNFILRGPSCQPTQLLKSLESTATFSHPRTESVILKLLDAHKVSLKQS